ncbi:MAG TPA: ABC transporter permease [Acidimicrobiia bacterium]|nr:ABC transporter permease [Acidimicrobiia bacterium]
MSRLRQRNTRTVSAQVSTAARLRDILQYRELLGNLVRMELRAKYKSSALGFAWSLLNPAMYLVVFYVAFSVILGSGIPRFPIYLLSGLLVWNFFTACINAGTGSIVAGSGLVKKVWFPREILPLASIGAGLVHFFLQSIVLVIALVVAQQPVGWKYMLLLPLALGALLILAAALTLLLSAANVYLRDIQHFVELALMAWFWVTPIIYQFTLLTEQFDGRAWPALLNPVTPIVLTFQRAFYGLYGDPPVLPPELTFGWYFRNLVVVTAASTVLLAVAMRVFRRLEGNLAEEL